MTTPRVSIEEWDMTSVLAFAWAVVEEYGWTSKTVAAKTRRPSTHERAQLAMTTGLQGLELEEQTTILGRIRPHLERGRQLAPIISEALLGQLDTSSGYEAELAALLRAGTVRPRQLGLAVSAIAVYKRLTERDLADEQADAKSHGQTERIRRAGKIGQKVTMSGQVVTALEVDGYTRNSPRQMMLVLDCGTAMAKLVTTARWAYQVHAGDTLTVEATVKAHHTYHGLPQTRLVRPKVLAGPTPAGPTSPAAPPNEATAAWETVRAAPPQSRFQEAPLAPTAPLARGLNI